MTEEIEFFDFCKLMNNMRYTKHFPAKRCMIAWDGHETFKIFSDEEPKLLGEEDCCERLISDIIKEMEAIAAEYRADM
tara:strand:- start:58 stop:291 length:234 start_codon:yes stop_codon:yes gene_type:complete